MTGAITGAGQQIELAEGANMVRASPTVGEAIETQIRGHLDSIRALETMRDGMNESLKDMRVYDLSRLLRNY